MTCIVAMADKERNKVVVGGDRASVASWTNNLCQEKVFRSADWAIGVSASWRVAQVIRYHMRGVFEELNPDIESVITKFIPAFIETLKKHKSLGTDEDKTAESPGGVVLGCGGNVFFVGGSLQVVQPITGYWASGSGDDYAYGALHALKDFNNREKLGSGFWLGADEICLKALEAAAEHNIGVRQPYDITWSE